MLAVDSLQGHVGDAVKASNILYRVSLCLMKQLDSFMRGRLHEMSKGQQQSGVMRIFHDNEGTQCAKPT